MIVLCEVSFRALENTHYYLSSLRKIFTEYRGIFPKFLQNLEKNLCLDHLESTRFNVSQEPT